MKFNKEQMQVTEEQALVTRMPETLQEKLHSLTIAAAFAAGIIDDIGDEKGNLFFEHADDTIDASYAIIQGHGVRISNKLVENQDDIAKLLKHLTFQKGVSNVPGEGFGKPYFRLGMPEQLRLGKATATVNGAVVEPTNADT